MRFLNRQSVRLATSADNMARVATLNSCHMLISHETNKSSNSFVTYGNEIKGYEIIQLLRAADIAHDIITFHHKQTNERIEVTTKYISFITVSFGFSTEEA